MQIERATQADAACIAQGVMMAVGDEIVLDFAESEERVALVHRLFERLAAGDCAQYSYRNTLVARADNGDVAGVIVSYDGARLYELREAFFVAAEEELGLQLRGNLPDETSDDEIYLDTIAVFPEYRKQGLATKLIEAAAEYHKQSGKPLGLLVEPENHNAYKLYTKLGFVKKGQRPFADTMMDHLQREKN